MIKLEHTVLATNEQMAFVIEGMRNPKNSWDRSDSFACSKITFCDDCAGFADDSICEKLNGIGSADLNLMKTLAKAGPVHRKYMRMIPVYVRITAPLYWWKEFDTYKVGTVANSCSTMHKIHSKEFTLEDFSTEHLITGSLILLEDTIDMLNEFRKWYLKWDYMTEEDRGSLEQDIHDKKDLWWQMIQLLPSSYNQTRNVMLNYEVLANIYEWRKDHKLDEWKAFCKWIEDLPHSELITGELERSNSIDDD